MTATTAPAATLAAALADAFPMDQITELRTDLMSQYTSLDDAAAELVLDRGAPAALDQLLTALLTAERRAHTRECPAARPDVPVELAAAIGQAVGDPASIVGQRRAPAWGQGHPAYADVEETITEWSTRAVLTVLAALAPSAARGDAS